MSEDTASCTTNHFYEEHGTCHGERGKQILKMQIQEKMWLDLVVIRDSG